MEFCESNETEVPFVEETEKIENTFSFYWLRSNRISIGRTGHGDELIDVSEKSRLIAFGSRDRIVILDSFDFHLLNVVGGNENYLLKYLPRTGTIFLDENPLQLKFCKDGRIIGVRTKSRVVFYSLQKISSRNFVGFLDAERRLCVYGNTRLEKTIFRMDDVESFSFSIPGGRIAFCMKQGKICIYNLLKKFYTAKFSLDSSFRNARLRQLKYFTRGCLFIAIEKSIKGDVDILPSLLKFQKTKDGNMSCNLKIFPNLFMSNNIEESKKKEKKFFLQYLPNWNLILLSTNESHRVEYLEECEDGGFYPLEMNILQLQEQKLRPIGCCGFIVSNLLRVPLVSVPASPMLVTVDQEKGRVCSRIILSFKNEDDIMMEEEHERRMRKIEKNDPKYRMYYDEEEEEFEGRESNLEHWREIHRFQSERKKIDNDAQQQPTPPIFLNRSYRRSKPSQLSSFFHTENKMNNKPFEKMFSLRHKIIEKRVLKSLLSPRRKEEEEKEKEEEEKEEQAQLNSRAIKYMLGRKMRDFEEILKLSKRGVSAISIASVKNRSVKQIQFFIKYVLKHHYDEVVTNNRSVMNEMLETKFILPKEFYGRLERRTMSKQDTKIREYVLVSKSHVFGLHFLSILCGAESLDQFLIYLDTRKVTDTDDDEEEEEDDDDDDRHLFSKNDDGESLRMELSAVCPDFKMQMEKYEKKILAKKILKELDEEEMELRTLQSLRHHELISVFTEKEEEEEEEQKQEERIINDDDDDEDDQEEEKVEKERIIVLKKKMKRSDELCMVCGERKSNTLLQYCGCRTCNICSDGMSRCNICERLIELRQYF